MCKKTDTNLIQIKVRYFHERRPFCKILSATTFLVETAILVDLFFYFIIYLQHFNHVISFSKHIVLDNEHTVLALSDFIIVFIVCFVILYFVIFNPIKSFYFMFIVLSTIVN